MTDQFLVPDDLVGTPLLEFDRLQISDMSWRGRIDKFELELVHETGSHSLRLEFSEVLAVSVSKLANESIDCDIIFEGKLRTLRTDEICAFLQSLRYPNMLKPVPSKLYHLSLDGDTTVRCTAQRLSVSQNGLK